MTASSSAAPGQISSSAIPAGVPALRAGQGHSFLWRRLHSISGIFPIGAFILEHFLSNAFATNGAAAYNEKVRFLTGLPFVPSLEIVFIYIPLAFHAGVRVLDLVARGEQRRRLSVDGQLDVHAAALDRDRGLLLHRVPHLDDALQRRAHPDALRQRLRQSVGELQNPWSWRSISSGWRGVVALRLRIGYLRRNGDRQSATGAQEIRRVCAW